MLTTLSFIQFRRLLPEQATRLRTYLAKGGVLWVDDFCGTFAWEQWLRELHNKVLLEATS